ncbi:MAG: CIA30 family protein [Acidobacteriota bacterium]
MTETQEAVVFDFGAGAEPWPSIDDPVMGGLSRSRMRLEGEVVVFEGIVSLENNGGFASARSRPARHRLAGFDGLTLRLRGDGKVYGVRLRTTRSFDGVSYQAKVETQAGSWQEIRIPFSLFEPGFRGRSVPDYPVLDPGEIRTFGLIISDKQEGPFRLEIDSIGAYRAAPSATAR